MNGDVPIKWIKSGLDNLKKYKYAFLVLLLGVCLLLIPSKEQKKTDPEVTDAPSIDAETQLASILRQIDGAGDVRVMLTISEGMEYIYQTDDRTRTDTAQQDHEKTTVLISDGMGGETAVVAATKYPTYLGALVVCEGADNAIVKLSIVNAVSDLTGLGSDKISVIKMKTS